ncbi:MAG: type IV secretion system protein [Aaplasma endosymbiont of Hyalomma asiaticum]
MLKFVLLAVVVLLSGCGGGKCIEPGEGFGSDQEVRVPVMPDGADSKRPASYWVNSGYSVSEKDKLKITVEGNIDFCPIDSSSPPVTVKMYHDSLSEKNEKYYDTHITVITGDQLKFSAFQYDLHFPTCEKIVRERSPIIYYGDGTIFTDKDCTNSIDVSKICSAGGEAVKLDDATGKRGKEFALYMKDGKDKCEPVGDGLGFPKVGGSTIKTPLLQFPIGYIADIEVSEKQQIAEGFIANGYVHDARTIRVGTTRALILNEENCRLLDGYATKFENLVNVKQIISPNSQEKFTSEPHKCGENGARTCGSNGESTEDNGATKTKILSLLREYTEYDINCNCGKICNPYDGKKDKCVKAIVNVSHDGQLLCPTSGKIYEKYEQDSEEQRLQFDTLKEGIAADNLKKAIEEIKVEIPGLDSKSFDVPDKKGSAVAPKLPYMLAEGVFAAIVPNYKEGGGGGVCATDECERITDKSKADSARIDEKNLILDEPMEVKKGGRLMLLYAHSHDTVGDTESVNANKRGFYTLSVHRTCYASGGKKLYVYVGDSPPTLRPKNMQGRGAQELDLDKYNNSGFSYTINGNSEKKKGNVYFAIDVDPGYEEQLRKAGNIENYYTVRVWTTKASPLFSTFFGYLQGVLLHVLYGSQVPADGKASEISEAVSKALDKAPGSTKSGVTQKIGAVQQIYKNQVVSQPFWNAVRALLTLYLMFSVLGYIMGVIQVTKYDLAVRIAKIAFILLLVSKGSWEFFNEHCFRIFTVGLSEIISAFNGYLGGDASFAFLDSTLGLFLTSGFWLRMLALFGAGPVGWLMFIGLLWALWSFFLAMIRGIIMYLFVVVALAFLVTLAPLFITFMLFQITRSLFDAWIKMIVNFSLQPIILFASLAFLNQVIQVTVHGVTNFTACESCVVGFDIASKDPKSPGKKDICVLPAFLPIGFSSDMSISDRVREEFSRTDIGFMGLPFNVAMLFILILACKATREFGQIAEVMAHSISGSVAGVTASVTGATQAMLGVVGMDAATQHLISAARGMTPVGTDKLHFKNEESSQPRHEGTDHEPGEKQDSSAGESAGSRNDGGVDIASGGSVSRAPEEGRDVVSGGSGGAQQREAGNDSRYVSMPVPGTSAFRNMSGDGQGGNIYSEIDDVAGGSSTVPEDSGHIYEEIDVGGATVSAGSTESLHEYEEIGGHHAGSDAIVDRDDMQGRGTEEISGNVQENVSGSFVAENVGDNYQDSNLASGSDGSSEVAVSTDGVRDTEDIGAGGSQFDDLLDNVESSSFTSLVGDSSAGEDVSGSSDCGTVERQSEAKPTAENHTQSFGNSNGDGWRASESVDTNEKSFSDEAADGPDSNSPESGDKRGLSAASEAQEKDSSLDEKLSKNPDNDPTKKDTQD